MVQKKRIISLPTVLVPTRTRRGRSVKGFAFWPVKRKITQRYQEDASTFHCVGEAPLMGEEKVILDFSALRQSQCFRTGSVKLVLGWKLVSSAGELAGATSGPLTVISELSREVQKTGKCPI